MVEWSFIRKNQLRWDLHTLYRWFLCLMNTPTIYSTCERVLAFPARLKYRKNMAPPSKQNRSSIDGRDSWNGKEGSYNSKLASERSLTLKRAIHQFNPIQVWDWLFKSCEVNGRVLLRDGLIDIKDIEKCILKGDCKKLGIKLPAWSILQCLVTSAKSDSVGLIISDEVELTKGNWPRSKVFEWFVGPLFIIKEQIKGLNISQEEELCLRKLVMEGKNEEPDDWNDGFPSSDKVRRAQLQAIIRRLQGIVASMSRLPTFRRRFKNLVKVLSLEAIQSGASAKHIGKILTSEPSAGIEGANDENGDAAESTRGNSAFNEGYIV